MGRVRWPSMEIITLVALLYLWYTVLGMMELDLSCARYTEKKEVRK